MHHLYHIRYPNSNDSRGVQRIETYRSCGLYNLYNLVGVRSDLFHSQRQYGGSRHFCLFFDKFDCNCLSTLFVFTKNLHNSRASGKKRSTVDDAREIQYPMTVKIPI